MKTFELNKNNTFCISVESNTERRDKMNNRFKLAELDVTFWNASTPGDLNYNFPYYLNDNARGCSQSHFNLWKYVIENKLEYAIIIEDDACFVKDWRQKLDTFVNVDDNEWDALFFNASESIETQNKWCIVQEQYLTGGYIISKRGCEKLINMFCNCLYASDWMTSRLQFDNKCYSYFPWLIIQEGSDSTIGSGYADDHKKVIRLLDEIQYSLDNYIV